MIKYIISLDRIIEKGTVGLLISSVFLMLLFAVINIVSRWFNISYSWIDPFVRHLVFLSAFLGGIMATGKGAHIGIDLVGKYLDQRKMMSAQLFINQFISLVSAVVSFWLAYSAINFSVIEFKFGKVIFWGIHSGFLVTIIPFGFSLIGIRFIFRIFILYSNAGESHA